MALTSAQLKAIQAQARRNIATRAAIQAKKISPQEARVAAAGMKRGEVPTYRGVYQDKPLLTKSEAAANAKSNKENAAKEAARQKQRKFAKGEGKLPIKQRVGTKAEYKALGKEIELRKDLIAAAKKAKAAQAARRANPTPAKATPAEPAKATPTKKAATPKPTTKKAAATPKAKEPKAPKASTAAIKARTVSSKLQTLEDAKSTAPKPKVKDTTKLQTLDEAKSKAPTPKGPGATVPEAPKAEAPKKETPKKSTIKNVASKSKVVRAASKTPIAQSAVATAKKLGQNKALRLAGKVTRVGSIIQVGREAAQTISGQAEKDFRRIQALENRIAVAKGQKPKYTTTGSNRNLVESGKVDASSYANALTLGILGQSRKARLQELKALAQKAEKKAATMPKPPANKPATGGKGGNKPSVTSTPPPAKVTGNKYRVTTGDTLSGIAARSGVSLKELRAANPQITDPRKIYRNTGVVIPKGGKIPTGGYTPTKKAK